VAGNSRFDLFGNCSNIATGRCSVRCYRFLGLTMDIDTLRQWIGRSQTLEDVAAATPLAGLAALLDHDTPPWAKGAVPPLGHWYYFLAHARQSEIDADGHPRRGGFLPPVDLPRRMWAGSRLRFHAAIAIGAPICKRSTILNVSAKAGASGQLVFVSVRHEIEANGALAVSEEQDIVYRAAAGAAPGPPAKREAAPRVAQHARRIVPDPTLLFRFSALTFNAHRIHYDRDYCRDVENYPGLVVQGPLIATLLIDHLLRTRPGIRVSEFRFRARKPLYDTAPFDLCFVARDGAVDMWARDADGYETMTAEAVVGE
jgi:3-methylfumaryl-CoA hydratase